MHTQKSSINYLKLIGLILLFFLLFTPNAFSSNKLRFGVPAWPGVTVKTEVVCQVLEKMGYDTEQYIVSLPMVFTGLQKDNLDIYLAGWDPLQSAMTDPLVKKGAIERVHVNVDDAISGLCVPNYVWDQGVHDLKDIHKFTDKFKKTIYCIEAGSGMADSLDEAMAQNADNIGDWKVVNSTTAGMLAQVRGMIEKKQWVVFFGWEPHWMTIEFDVKFLKPSEESKKIARRKSTVYTILPAGFEKKNPNIYKFFQQFDVKPEVQSYWIHQYGFKNVPLKEMAKDWIKNNRPTVERWVKGVTTTDGKPAIDAVYN